MFREMRRFKQSLSEDECVDLLRSQKRGVLSVLGEDGYPYGLPVNFVYDEGDGRIYVHSAKVGHKIDAITADNRVCFTTWNDGELDDDGWSYHLKSVVAFGTAQLVSDERITREKARLLGSKYFPTEDILEDEMRTAVNRVQMIAITIDHLSGKRVHER